MDDAERLLNYLRDIGDETCYLTYRRNELKLTVEQERRYIQISHKRSKLLYLAAFCDKEICGILNFEGGVFERISRRGEMSISVRRAWRNLGIANALMDEFLEWFDRHETLHKVKLLVRADNSPALRLYEKKGFQVEANLIQEIWDNESYIDVLALYRFKEANNLGAQRAPQ